MQSVQPIMIVDDEPDITYIMKKVFQVNGIVADSFNDAEEALSHFKPGVYGLLILDIGMPKMNGFELYGEMRKIDAELKVCFLSAYETYGEHRAFPQTEIRCILKKPIRMTELVEHVRLEKGQWLQEAEFQPRSLLFGNFNSICASSQIDSWR